MTNDQFFLFPMLSYGYKNTVGVVAHLFFSDPPLRPHASKGVFFSNGSADKELQVTRVLDLSKYEEVGEYLEGQ